MSYRSVPRRTVLKVLASSPLIPLAASLGSKCVFANNQTSPVSISFTHMPSPSSVAEKTAVYTQSNIVIKYADGKTSTKALSYQMLYSTGDLMKTPSGKDIIAGGYFNVAGEPIMDRSGDKPERRLVSCQLSGSRSNTLGQSADRAATETGLCGTGKCREKDR